MKEGMRKLLGARDLLKVVASQSFSVLANQIVAFVIPWIVLAQTGDAFYAGVVAFAAGATHFVGALFGGVITDRIGGRITSIIADVLSLATILILATALFVDFVPFWLILVTHTLGILLDGPGVIAKDTLVPLISKREKIPLVRASSLQEVLQGIAMFIGPTLAGLLVAVLTESIALAVVAVIFAICALLILRVHQPRIRHEEKMTTKKALGDLWEGVTFLRKEPLLGPLTLAGMGFSGVFTPLVTIIFPAWFVLANQGADVLGIFLGTQALGTLIGGMIFAVIGPRISGYVWAILSNALVTILYGAMLFFEPGSAMLIVLSFMIGLASAGMWPILNTAYYTRTPERLFGRVNGASWALQLLGLPFTSLFFGWFVSATSAELALMIIVAANSILTIVLWLYPPMKMLDTRHSELKPANAKS